jgi:gluconokinase
MVIVLMGVAGAGKTTVGRRLAERLNWLFCDGDGFHSAMNIDKMKRGDPLTDEDRRAWLEELRRAIAQWVRQRVNVVLACSLLKRSYRETVIDSHHGDVKLVYLQAGRSLLEQRLTSRSGHFAGISLLDSQLEVLEEPTDVLVLDASDSPEQLVQHIRLALNLPASR